MREPWNSAAPSTGEPCSSPYTFGHSVCGTLTGFDPWDEYPIRSPLLMADLLLEEVRSRSIVELGTRNGDIFACLSRLAAKAIAVEKDPKYCASLRRRGFEVVCEEVNATSALQVLPDADVYFLWGFIKQNLKILHNVDAAVRARNRTAVFYYALTGNFGPEIEVLPSDLVVVRGPRFHRSGAMVRLFFEEPCLNRSSTCAHEPPRPWQTAKGPDRHWGVFHLLRLIIGVGGHDRAAASPARGIRVTSPRAPNAKWESRLGHCPVRQTIGESRCSSLRGFVAKAAYPFRSPLVVSDYLVDVLGVSRKHGRMRTLAIADHADDDLSSCLGLRRDTQRLLTVASGFMTEAVDVWYWAEANAKSLLKDGIWSTSEAVHRKLSGSKKVVPSSLTLVRELARIVRARSADGTAVIGLDGYSSADMELLPTMLDVLNQSGYRTHVRRLPFDESPGRIQAGAAGASPVNDRQPLTQGPPRRGLLSHHLGVGGSWRRWGVWHLVSVELTGAL